MKYIIHQKAFYSDGIGLILAFSNSKEKAFKYVRENYPEFKRDSSQDSRGEFFFGDEKNQELILVEENGFKIEIL